MEIIEDQNDNEIIQKKKELNKNLNKLNKFINL